MREVSSRTLEGAKRLETWPATAGVFFCRGAYIESNLLTEVSSITLEGAKRAETWPATAGVIFLVTEPI